MIQVGVGAVVTRVGLHGAKEVLLVQRLNDPGKGMYAIPGGRMKPGETLKSAAEREILEETSIVINAEDRGFWAFDVVVKPGVLQYVVVDVMASYVSGEAKAGDDAGQVVWADCDAFEKLPVNEETRRLVFNIAKIFQ